MGQPDLLCETVWFSTRSSTPFLFASTIPSNMYRVETEAFSAALLEGKPNRLSSDLGTKQGFARARIGA